MGDLHCERPGYVATIMQKLSEPDPQTRDEALELLARLPGSAELGQALDQGHLSPATRTEVLHRALSNPILPVPLELEMPRRNCVRIVQSQTRIISSETGTRTAPAHTRPDEEPGQAR